MPNIYICGREGKADEAHFVGALQISGGQLPGRCDVLVYAFVPRWGNDMARDTAMKLVGWQWYREFQVFMQDFKAILNNSVVVQSNDCIFFAFRPRQQAKSRPT